MGRADLGSSHRKGSAISSCSRTSILRDASSTVHTTDGEAQRLVPHDIFSAPDSPAQLPDNAIRPLIVDEHEPVRHASGCALLYHDNVIGLALIRR